MLNHNMDLRKSNTNADEEFAEARIRRSGWSYSITKLCLLDSSFHLNFNFKI